ncbi:DUF2878 family protein [bacterium]|nr:DUF2878 family protein [bacterium]
MHFSPIGHAFIYQLTWVATLVGWQQAMVWLGPLCAMAHLLAVIWHRRDVRFLGLFIVFMGAGFGVETMNQAVGLIRYSPDLWAPWWIAPLWGGFSLFCSLGLSWIRHLWVMVLAGLVGGPLTYLAAAGWLNQSLGVFQIIGFGLEWAILFPISILTSRYIIQGKRSPL